VVPLPGCLLRFRDEGRMERHGFDDGDVAVALAMERRY
jgi:hypothetical protein